MVLIIAHFFLTFLPTCRFGFCLTVTIKVLYMFGVSLYYTIYILVRVSNIIMGQKPVHTFVYNLKRESLCLCNMF